MTTRHFLLLLLSACFRLSAQSPAVFHNHGIGGGGYMYAPGISPHDPNLLFINCDMGGMYRSEDGGNAFEMLHRDQMVAAVKGKVQFTSDPDLLYAVRRSLGNTGDPLWRGELVKSTDGGKHWQLLPDPTATGIHRLEADPNSTQRLLLNEYDRLFFSNDGGNSWSQAYVPATGNMWLGGVFWDGNNIYVGTGEGLVVSKNGGASFALEAHSGLPAGTGIYQLCGARAGNVPRFFAVAAATDDLLAWAEPRDFDGKFQGIFRMNYAAGAGWTNVRNNLPAEYQVAAIGMARNNAQIVWAACANADDEPAIFKSTNNGNAWTNTLLPDNNQNIATGWEGHEGAYWMYHMGEPLGFEVAPQDANTVLFTRAGAYLSKDGGAQWAAVSVDPASRNNPGNPSVIAKFYQTSGLDVTSVHQIFWKNDDEVLACNTDIGLTYSSDQGLSWTFSRNTFQPWGVVSNNNWYRVIQPDGQHLFAAAGEINDMYLDYRLQDWNIDGGGVVLRSANGGVSWDTAHNFGHPVVWLEQDRLLPQRMYAAVAHYPDGGIFQSDDGGASWTRLPAPPRTQGRPYNIVSLNDGGLAASYSARDVDGSLNLSESSGVFYLPAGSHEWLDRSADAMKYYTKDLVVDPHDPNQNTWYATVWGRTSTFPGPVNQGNGGLYRSTDRGQSWTRIFAREMTESISIHPSKPGTAYVSVENDGLYFTENLGENAVFARVESFPFWRPKRVFFKPGHDDEIWVGTMGGGIWSGRIQTPGKITYDPDNGDFPNPERGFIEQFNTHSNAYEPLNAAYLQTLRNGHQPWNGQYSVYSSLFYRGFYLENFVNAPISNAYLNAMQQDFDAARQAGVKLIPRFAYTLNTDNGGCEYCPPYGDAPKSRVLEHIAQLKPLLLANADVIAAVEMGFIGIWGEGYYTDHFGDASQPPYGLTAQNWNDRTEVLNALLEALPPDRCVQVRYPQMKQKAVYGPAAGTSSQALTPGEAFQNSAKARVGHHNDCFLSSADDVGTYQNYDVGFNDSDTLHLKPYMADDSRFVPVGGETCEDWNPYSDCVGSPGGSAQREMERMHWSYLNAGYNNDLNNDWVTGGCIEEIKKRLGYRLELQEGEFSTDAMPGGVVNVHFSVKNKGFAAPFNPRKLRLILRNQTTGERWFVDLPDDPRTWLPGPQTHTIDHRFCLPVQMPPGDYELLLQLADPYPALTERPEYAIRLANEGLWEPSTGYNRLLHHIQVGAGQAGDLCNGENCFQSTLPYLPDIEFEVSATTGCSPLTVTITGLNDPCAEYEWQFPGGVPEFSTEPNPTVVFANPGTYSMYFTSRNAHTNMTAAYNDYFTVTEPLVAAFTPGLDGFDAYFSNQSENATHYLWNFGDPASGTADTSTLDAPVVVHSYSAPGVYTVTLTAYNDCGAETVSQQVTIQCNAPDLFIGSGGPTQVCAGDTVLLLAPPDDWSHFQWYRNGQAIPGAESNEFWATVAGVYKLFAADQHGCGNFSNEITLEFATLPTASISSSAQDGAACAGDWVALHGEGGVGYFWQLPSGTVFNGQDLEFLPVAPAQSGLYFLTVTNGAGCTATVEYALTVHELTPVQILNLAPSYSVQDTPFVLMGDPPGGYFYGWGVQDGIFYPGSLSPGTYGLIYRFEDAFGCAASDTAYFIITPAVSTVEAGNHLEIKLFPNPNTGQFWLECKLSESSDLNIRIWNNLQQSVQNYREFVGPELRKISLGQPGLPPGLYLVEVNGPGWKWLGKLLVLSP